MSIDHWFHGADLGFGVHAPGFQGLFMVHKDAQPQLLADLIQARPGSIIRGYESGMVTFMPIGIPDWMYDYVAGMISEET